MSDRDEARVGRVRRALSEARVDAVVCALPANVLLLSGYWPVIGTACAIVTRDGAVAVIAPSDERALAVRGWASTFLTFQAGSLRELTTVVEAIRAPLAEAGHALGLEGARLGYEGGAWYEPATYASMFLYGEAMHPLLERCFAPFSLVPFDDTLSRLRSVKTDAEVTRIAAACRVAERAFVRGAPRLCVGMEETEAAALIRAPLSTDAVGRDGIERADGFVYCMSGANSALAHGAYARSRATTLAAGTFVLVHCNSYADGFWTDITRTYYLGEPNAIGRRMYEAVFAARSAALDAIRPGVRAADVDRAAREVLASHGFGGVFKHSTGHGVGFAAIDHNARPRLHPASDEVLESGMVFNVEPAIYIDGYGGVRHCDMVAVTADGHQVLTPFHARLEELIVG